jgi:hypothetical protein
MVPMNSFITSNQSHMHKFFEEMLLPVAEQSEEQRAEEEELFSLETQRLTAPNHAILRDLVSFLQSNLSRIQETGLDPSSLHQLEEALSSAR